VVLKAQQSTPPVDVSMKELVGEVRALRQAVERTAGVTARTQALLGRVQLQENRLGDLGRRLDDARQRVRTATSQAAAQETEVAHVMVAVEESPTGRERDHMETELKRARARATAAQGEVAQLRAEEQELIGALSSEQARWSDYNARLEAIEQDFARGPAGRQP
jgi:chromosome segregation ATPase